MARIAGLFLAERWEDWDTHESIHHVSVWEKSSRTS
jgi:hypothetical protein